MEFRQMRSSRFEEFLHAWFPSMAEHTNPAVFFTRYNEFLSLMPTGKRVVLEDKILLAAALHAYGIRTPTTLVSINRGRFFSPGAGEISQAEVARLLEGKEAFIKSATGWGGVGAFRLHADGSIHKADGSKTGRRLPKLLTKIKGMDYLIQEMIQQDDRFSAVANSSINTVRCVTFRDRLGDIHIAASTWRMGDGRSVIDNGTSGGIVCGIDPATGRILGPGRTLAGASHEKHPLSGFEFEGAEVPDIQVIFETAKAAHRALGTGASVGWDVAMTPDGPMIIEGNDPWGARGHVLVDADFARRTWDLFMTDRKVAGSGFPAEKRRGRRLGVISATLSIHGKVQGVGYRNWVSGYAEQCGVTAAPTNMDDGTVSCELKGQRWRVEFVTLACHRGPSAAVVEKIDVQSVRRL